MKSEFHKDFVKLHVKFGVSLGLIVLYMVQVLTASKIYEIPVPLGGMLVFLWFAFREVKHIEWFRRGINLDKRMDEKLKLGEPVSPEEWAAIRQELNELEDDI